MSVNNNNYRAPFNAGQIEEIAGTITEVVAMLEQEQWLAEAIAETVADRLAALEGGEAQ